MNTTYAVCHESIGDYSTLDVKRLILHFVQCLCLSPTYASSLQTGWLGFIVDAANENPLLWALYAVVPILPCVLFIWCCCRSSVSTQAVAWAHENVHTHVHACLWERCVLVLCTYVCMLFSAADCCQIRIYILWQIVTFCSTTNTSK